MTLAYTPVSSIPKIVAASRAAFATHRTQSIEFRKTQLRAFLQGVTDNTEALGTALKADLSRSFDFETSGVIKSVKGFIDNLDEWTKPAVAPGTVDSDECYVRLSPLGTVLVIGAWNFPITLLLEPIAGAIAAGNTVVVKPSEVSTNCAQVMTRILETYLDPSVVTVVNGGAEETTVLLKERFDHIFYTGGTEVGRIVMMAAAKNLTPVTLELGGKCPVIITRNTDIAKAAQRIAGWKTLNCGQVCLSVDYVLCPKDLQQALIQNVIGVWQHMFAANAQTSPAYSRIINTRQQARLEKLLEVAKTQNTIVCGGKMDSENLFIEPTILTDVSTKDEIMKDEIFGPILPILTCETLDEAIHVINQGENPLALYLFSNDKAELEKVAQETRSGGLVVNDIGAHFANHNLPFGGVGYSGTGAYHGKYSLDTFSHKRSFMVRSQAHL